MVSKESEYLIHLAEQQLERLNKSLYFYQRNNEIQSDLLECSSDRFDNETSSISLTPIYAIIDRQRKEVHSRGASGSSTDLSPSRGTMKKLVNTYQHSRPCKNDVNDNIRDWRNGVKLARRTLGPRKRSPNNVSYRESSSPKNNKKEKLSTFWDYNGHKSNGKASKSLSNVSKHENVSNKCCEKKNAYNRNEIRKYIRDKQRSFKEKEFESHLNNKCQKERMHSSLIKLDNDRHYDCNMMMDLDNYDHFSRKSNKRCDRPSPNRYNQRKIKMNQPVYDELNRDGMFNLQVSKKIENPIRFKNGFSSTVDSGFETGEWLQVTAPDKVRISNGPPYDQLTNLSPKAIRDAPWRQEVNQRPPVTSKSKTDYYNLLKKEYKDGISAYDAGSENEVANGRKITLHNMSRPPSPYLLSDNDTKSPNQNLTQLRSIFNVPDNHIGSPDDVGNAKIIDGKLSISLPNCNADFSPDVSFKKSQGDFRSTESSQMCLVDELKEALLDAQMQLNPGTYEPIDSLSERISRAVQNFIKTKTKSIAPKESANGDTLCPSVNLEEIEKHSRTENLKSDNSIKKNDMKKDHLSTECEATEIELEQCKQTNNIPEKDQASFIRHEIREIAEENNSFSMDSDPSLVIDDAMKEGITAKLATKTKDLQSRREKANELIKLTKEFKKENKRVKLLEKKACKFSKQYLQDPLCDMKGHESVDSLKPNLMNVNIVKYPRHAIPPDGKDSGRSDVKDTFENQLSPLAKVPKISSEKSKEDYYPAAKSARQSISEMSDVDEPTASISEVTTTLSDRSELEARLVALRAEVSKKHQIVELLKSHQKEMKRDKIKQKEVTLQKQIDMYDDYIKKLQGNIAELDFKKADDASSDDDSHTLTGSVTNINELESRVDEINAKHTNNFDPIVEKEVTFDDIYNNCEKEMGEDVSLDRIFENNKVIAGDNADLDWGMESKEIQIVKDYPDQTINGSNDDQLIVKCLPIVDSATIERISESYEFEDILSKNENELTITVEDGNGEMILEELESENLRIMSQVGQIHYNVTTEGFPEISEDHKKQQPEREQKEVHNYQENATNVKKSETSTEILILEVNGADKSCENSFVDTISHSVESTSNKKDNSDHGLIQIQNPSGLRKDSLEGVDDLDIEGGDVDIVNSDPIDFLDISSPPKIKTAFDSVIGDPELISFTTNMPVLESDQKATTYISESTINGCGVKESSRESQYSVEIEHIVESLLNTMISSEIERLHLHCATSKTEPKSLSSVSEIVDFESTSFITPSITILTPPTVEKPSPSDTVVDLEHLWEFTNVTVKEQSEILDTQLLLTNICEKEPESIAKSPDSISIIDKELLAEKIKWLIPLQSQYLDSHIDSAISHFFQAKNTSSQESIKRLLLEASDTLPTMYTESEPVVTESEIGDALFDSIKQHSYIDKRVIFHLIKEIFSEIYSSERYLPQFPWVHSSFMMKRKNYTTWKGNRPPESQVLVKEIVRERIYRLFFEKNISLDDVPPKSRETSNHSKITKWCIERQKDKVDKILINDLRKEENEWIYYDEAEEEVKIQIAEDVFNFLITDTVSWWRSNLSHT